MLMALRFNVVLNVNGIKIQQWYCSVVWKEAQSELVFNAIVYDTDVEKINTLNAHGGAQKIRG
jgi:hypothetical protein